MIEVQHARHLKRVIESTRRYFFAGAAGVLIGISLQPPPTLFPVSLCVGALAAMAWSALILWRPQWERRCGFPIVFLPPLVLSGRYGSDGNLFSMLSLLPTIIGSLLLVIALAIVLFRTALRKAAESYLRCALESANIRPSHAAMAALHHGRCEEHQESSSLS